MSGPFQDFRKLPAAPDPAPPPPKKVPPWSQALGGLAILLAGLFAAAVVLGLMAGVGVRVFRVVAGE